MEAFHLPFWLEYPTAYRETGSTLNKLARLRISGGPNVSEPIIAGLIGAAVIALGWFVASQLATRRSIDDFRRRLRVEYLMDTYRTLEAVSYRDGGKKLKEKLPLERAIADLQLLGNRRQIALAVRIAEEIEEKGIASTEEILQELRQMVRKELGLRQTRDQLIFFRWRFRGTLSDLEK